MNNIFREQVDEREINLRLIETDKCFANWKTENALVLSVLANTAFLNAFFLTLLDWSTSGKGMLASEFIIKFIILLLIMIIISCFAKKRIDSNNKVSFRAAMLKQQVFLDLLKKNGQNCIEQRIELDDNFVLIRFGDYRQNIPYGYIHNIMHTKNYIIIINNFSHANIFKKPEHGFLITLQDKIAQSRTGVPPRLV